VVRQGRHRRAGRGDGPAVRVELGGELHLNAPVERVTVDADGRHQVSARGQTTTFDLVVSNADLDATYGKLYGAEPRAKPMQKKLAKSDWSMSLFVLYFGTDQTYADRIAHHTVVFGKRYRELLKEIFHGPALPDDMSLYLHAPHLTDPSLAPAGHGAFYVLSPVPHLGNAAVDWAKDGAGYADKVLATLEPLLPDLRQHVTTKRWITPLTFRDELAAKHGAAFSVAPRLTQSAYFRPHNKCDHIPNLYLVGPAPTPAPACPAWSPAPRPRCR
jgi:phytoene desaturase